MCLVLSLCLRCTKMLLRCLEKSANGKLIGKRREPRYAVVGEEWAFGGGVRPEILVERV